MTYKTNMILNKKQVLNLLQNDLLTGQRMSIVNNQGKLFITKVIDLVYKYKNPSGFFDDNMTLAEVKKWVICGKEKYKLIALPSGINSFSYDLVKLF